MQRHETRYSHPRPLVFIHKDFGPSNILMHDSRVSGVIDFGNIAIGDADADFVEIWENMGDGALRAVAAAYGHPNPDDLFNAVRDFSVLNGLEVLVDDKTFAPKGVWQGLQARFEEKFGNST